MLTLLLATLVSTPSALPAEPEAWTLRGDAQRGKARFLKTCALCHGADGGGKGKIALDPPARDLRDPAARAYPSDWGAYVVVRDGGAKVGLSPRMIAYGKSLDEDDLHDVVRFVQELAHPQQ
jgi:mono/diheme cytochrome c family protein